jgi:hypothetical protein
VSYASSAPAVATIVDGKLHILTAGSVTITASQPGDANWHAASSVKHALTIGPALIIPTQSYHPGVSPSDTISQTLLVRVEDPAIRTFYAEMKRLVEAHDVPGFLALFAPDYFHAGHDLTGQLDGGPDMFDAVRTFTFDITGISVTASDAMVAGTATFAFDAGDATETWTEADMTNHSPGIGWLRKTPTGWRVIGDQKRARVSVATTHGTTPDDERNALLLRTESSLEITGASVSGLGIATTELQPDPETGGWRAEIGNFTNDDRPPVGTVYTFVIGFADGSQATYQDSVKAWVAAGPIVSVTTDAGSAVIHWTAVNAAVANAESYGVRVSGPGLDWASDPLPLTQSSAVFNDNGHAQGTLQSGQHYVAEVFILNQSGDSASQRIEFSMP